MDKKKLYRKAMELAKSADFQFWEGEAWAPELQAIDWSCDYDDEVVELVKLTVRECAQMAGADSRTRILEHFGLEK